MWKWKKDKNKDQDQDWGELVLNELLKERRKDRFWRNVKFFGIVAMFGVGIFIRHEIVTATEDTSPDKPYVAVVEIEGVMQPGSTTASDERLRDPMNKAFSDEKAEGVAIRVSSPGGTPVQAEMIRARIERLKERHDKRVIVVAEESLASGAYLAAMAADRIYAQPATIVGSIGVRMSGFGASELIDRAGVNRRIYTAGENKVILDPFQPEDPQAVDHVQGVLDEIHSQFKAAVINARGDKLKASKEQLMSGLYWTGNQAHELGLVDGTKTMAAALDEEYGTTEVKSYGPSHSIFARINQFAKLATQLMSGQPMNRIQSVW